MYIKNSSHVTMDANAAITTGNRKFVVILIFLADILPHIKRIKTEKLVKRYLMLINTRGSELRKYDIRGFNSTAP
jgi:hypothetical protein